MMENKYINILLIKNFNIKSPTLMTSNTRTIKIKQNNITTIKILKNYPNVSSLNYINKH